ncbi:uncharacterized protein LOC144167839 [Haemaphysalis longicornis]
MVALTISKSSTPKSTVTQPVGHSTVNDFIPETCTAIYEELNKDYIKSPKTVEDWQWVIRGFGENWQFPNCVGAIYGKHICITKPPNSGFLYFNHKKTFSIILHAVVDANYEFLYADVGVPGAQGDAGVWQNSPLQEALEDESANLPDHVEVGSGLVLPPVFVADDAFPLGKNDTKPYGGCSLPGDQRIFNYRFLLTAVNARSEKVVHMVHAACVLHNYLGNDMTALPDSGPEVAREQRFFGLQRTRGRANAFGATVRDDMRDYFNGQGAVSWQRASAYVNE